MDMKTLGAAIDSAVGAELRALRAKRRLSQDELSRVSGVGKRTIARFEAGERSPDLHQLYALCRVLNIAPGDFMATVMSEIESVSDEGDGIPAET